MPQKPEIQFGKEKLQHNSQIQDILLFNYLKTKKQ